MLLHAGAMTAERHSGSGAQPAPRVRGTFANRAARWCTELWADLLALFWPCACVACGAADRELCALCAAALRNDAGTAECVLVASGSDVWVHGAYEGALRAILVAYKHGGKVIFATMLGELLSGPLREAARGASGRSPPLIVTAPSRAERVRERGYRHVDLLVSRALRRLRRESRRKRWKEPQPPPRRAPGGGPSQNACPYLVVGALRAMPGRTGQVGLRSMQRVLNAALVRVPVHMRGRLRGREVVIVDDIVTTGATLDAAAEALAAVGAVVIAKVALCAVARRDHSDGREGAEPLDESGGTRPGKSGSARLDESGIA